MEQLRATIGAGRDKLQLPELEMAPVGRIDDSSLLGYAKVFGG